MKGGGTNNRELVVLFVAWITAQSRHKIWTVVADFRFKALVCFRSCRSEKLEARFVVVHNRQEIIKLRDGVVDGRIFGCPFGV